MTSSQAHIQDNSDLCGEEEDLQESYGGVVADHDSTMTSQPIDVKDLSPIVKQCGTF